MAKQPFVPVDRVLRIRLAGSYQTSIWVNGLAAQYIGAPPDNTQLTTLATSIRQAWSTAWSTVLIAGTVLNSVQVWDISSDSGAIGTSTSPVSCTGTASSLIPVNSAVVLTYRVQSRWRGGHFRTYMVPRNLSDLTSGRTLTQTAIDAYVNAGTAFRTAFNALTLGGSPITLGGVRYFPTGFNTDGSPIVKTSGQFFAFPPPAVRNRLDSQRRRLGKELA